MRSFRSDLVRALALSAALAGAAAPAVQAQQTRDIVSKEVTVGRDEAVLRLDIAGGGSLDISLDGGKVSIGDAVVGEYTPGGSLDTAWRTLLGTAVALEDGPLSRALVGWSPPEGLDAADSRVADAIDGALEDALESPAPAEAPAAPEAPVAGVDVGALTRLLSRANALPGLAAALDDLDLEDLRITVGEDMTVGPEDQVDATVVVVDGDLEVEGLIRGDVVVVGGDVDLRPGSRITGELRHADGRVRNDGGEVEGGVREVDTPAVVSQQEIRNRIRDEVRSATRTSLREATRRNRGWSAFSRVGDAVGGAFGDLFTVLILGIVGGFVLYFAGSNLDAVAETARRTPGRAALVGTAGAFLVLPAWILGIIALAISIIGIPALILWIPLFPVAVVLAAGLGYLAVARNVGSWLSRQHYPYLDWVRVTNPYSLIFGGLGVLMAAFIAAHLVSAVPFLGILEGLLVTAGVVATIFAMLVGFGAVILTRAGRRPEFWSEDLFSASTAGWDDFAEAEAATSAPDVPDAPFSEPSPSEPDATAESAQDGDADHGDGWNGGDADAPDTDADDDTKSPGGGDDA